MPHCHILQKAAESGDKKEKQEEKASQTTEDAVGQVRKRRVRTLLFDGCFLTPPCRRPEDRLAASVVV